MPYAIVRLEDGEVVARFAAVPLAFDIVIDGHRRRVVSPVTVGDEGLGHRFVNLVEVDYGRPGVYYDQGQTTDIFDGNVTVTSTRSWVAWDQARIDAYEGDRLDRIAAFVADTDDPIRAALLVMLDEFNRHSAVHRAILSAASAATSLADFKTRMGQIQGIPARQPSDLLDAVRGKLGA